MGPLTGATPGATALMRVLIVTDHERSAGFLKSQLEEERTFSVLVARSVGEGLTKAQADWPALVVLDVAQDAVLEICKTLKADRGTSRIPLVILTQGTAEADRITGLEAGADDCVARSINPREIVLRIRAVLRRIKRPTVDEHFVRGPIRLDPARYRVAVNNKPVQLTAVEFKLLRTLVTEPGRIQSREALQGEARGTAEAKESRTVDTHIRRLRRKLGKAAHLVETVRGIGYRLRPT